MHDSLPRTIHEEPPARAWSEHVSWGMMFAAGWMIYEVTAKPWYGVAVACGKFGWDDFVTACWLLRTDPNPGRGRACFWFQAALGLWRITIASFIASGLLLMVATAMNQNPPDGLKGTGLTAALGALLLSFVPLIGVHHARRNRIRVWVDSSIHDSRRENLWPPRAGGFNSAMGLLLPALMVPVLGVAILSIFLGLTPMLFCLFGTGILIWWLFRSVCAESPQECWPEQALFVAVVEEPVDADDFDYKSFSDLPAGARVVDPRGKEPKVGKLTEEGEIEPASGMDESDEYSGSGDQPFAESPVVGHRESVISPAGAIFAASWTTRAPYDSRIASISDCPAHRTSRR